MAAVRRRASETPASVRAVGPQRWSVVSQLVYGAGCVVPAGAGEAVEMEVTIDVVQVGSSVVVPEEAVPCEVVVAEAVVPPGTRASADIA